MNAITELTRKLSETNPEWTVSSLRNGAANPLVTSGILTYARLSPVYECQNCDADCPGTLTYFNRHREGRGALDLAAHCPRDGHLIEIDPAALQVWQCDPDRLAELVCDAFDCEGCQRSTSGRLYSLGVCRRTLGNFSRQICLLDRLDDEEDSILKKEAPKSAGYLLFVGQLNCEIKDQQFRRRVFTFDEVFRLQDDGRLEIVFDSIMVQLGVPLEKSPRRLRSDKQQTEKEIAKYLLDIGAKMLGKDAKERKEFRIEALSFESIGKVVGVSKSKISENYLGAECMKQFLHPHRLLYKLIREEGWFPVFERYAKSLRCPICHKDINDVFQGLLTEYLTQNSRS